MSKVNLFSIGVVVFIIEMIGGCESTKSRITSTSVNHTVKDREISEEKGCLSCHNGIETINDRMQPFLLSFAKQKYGKGKGYECAVCHGEDGKKSMAGMKKDAANLASPKIQKKTDAELKRIIREGKKENPERNDSGNLI